MIRVRAPRLPAFLSILLAVPLLASFAPPSARAGGEGSPLGPGILAVEFEIEPDYSATLSMKRFSSERAAWRLGVVALFRETDSDGREDLHLFDPYRPDTLDASGRSGWQDEYHSYGVFLHAVRHRPVDDRASFFVEAGPSFRYLEDRRSRSGTFLGSSSSEAHFEEGVSLVRTVALDALVGFEWYFARRLSLGARIGASGGYNWGATVSTTEYWALDGTSSYRRSSRGDRDGVEIRTTRAALSLTVFL